MKVGKWVRKSWGWLNKTHVKGDDVLTRREGEREVKRERGGTESKCAKNAFFFEARPGNVQSSKGGGKKK